MISADAVEVLRRTAALVVVSDADGCILDVNSAVLTATGRDEDDLVGAELQSVLCAPRDVRDLLHVIRSVARTGVARAHEHFLPDDAPDRSSIAWATALLSEEPRRLVSVGVDVTEARSLADLALARALTDELTGLPNRSHLLQTLERMSSTGGAVHFCDLNGFKAVNDTYGHAAGDAVLVEVARRLRLAVRGEDFVARLGGDEFVIVAPPHPTASSAGLARRVLGAMRQPMLLAGGVVVVVGVSVGTAQMEPGQDPKEVLAQADAQMYTAKSLRATGAGRRPDVG